MKSVAKTSTVKTSSIQAKNEEIQQRRGGKRKRNRVKKNGPKGTGVKGQTSTNLNRAKNASSDPILATSLPVTPLTLTSAIETVTGWGLGVISYAFQRGFPAFAPDPNYLYWAWVYIGTVIQASMQDGVLKTQTVPQFMKDILDAVSPTHRKIGNGYIAYNWSITFDTATQSYLYDLKPTGVPRHWNAGIVDTTFVNNLWHNIAVPAAYTEAGGLAAWSSLLEFYSTIGQGKLATLVPANGPGRFRLDTSAFSVITKELGNSGSNTGGYGKVVSSEVPIDNPLFACFTGLASGQISDPSRYPSYNVNTSGDTTMVGGMQASDFNALIFSSRIAPIFKNVDFLQFVEVLALWYTEMAQVAVADGLDGQYLVSDSDYYTLQMTLQEFMFLVRNIMMNTFEDTQFFVQNNYPTDSFNNNNPFLPFVSGQGTYPVPVTGMKLPQLFVENLRALTYVTQKSRNPITYLPVLGMYKNDALNWQDYFYMLPNSEAKHYIFTDPSLSVKIVKTVPVKGAQSREEVSYGVETVISVVDGSTGSAFVAINSPFGLETLTDLWNNKLNALTPFCDSLTTLGKDAGITVLRVLTVTDVHFENIQGHPSMPANHKVVKRVIPERLIVGVDSLTSVSPYIMRNVLATTVFNNPLANPWEIIMQYWNHPDVQLMLTGQQNEIITAQKWAAITREYSNLTFTSGDDQYSLYQRHLEYARMMIRYRNGEETMATILLKELEKTGRGGILSSLVGGIVKAIAPGSAKVVDTIASFVPF